MHDAIPPQDASRALPQWAADTPARIPIPKKRKRLHRVARAAARPKVAAPRIATVEMYPVYAVGPVLGTRPLGLVTGEQRAWFLANGSAKIVSRGTAIQLLLTLEQIRGMSCQMGPTVIERAVHSELFKSFAEGYQEPRYSWPGSYCPLVPVELASPPAYA